MAQKEHAPRSRRVNGIKCLGCKFSALVRAVLGLSPASLPTPALVDAKLNPYYSRFGDLRLILRDDPGLLHLAPAVRAAGRHGNFHHLVHRVRNLPPTATAVIQTCFPSWFLGIGFGLPARERCRLAARRSRSTSACSLSFSAPSLSIFRSNRAIVSESVSCATSLD